jgi:hypothetical protein
MASEDRAAAGVKLPPQIFNRTFSMKVEWFWNWSCKLQKYM